MSEAERPGSSPRERRALIGAFLVLAVACGVVLAGFLLDLSIVLVWPLTLAVVLIGLGANAYVHRRR